MILVLDPSFRATGWAVFKNKILIACGCIPTKNIPGLKITDGDTENLKHIALEIKHIIDKYKCTEVIFENPSGSKSSRAMQSLSYLKGLIIAACIFSNINFRALRAKTVKLSLIGDSNATKDQILEKVRENYSNFDILTKDFPKFKVYASSDAVALMLCV